MPISEQQLEAWSHQGSIITSSSTYSSVRAALAAVSSPLRTVNHEIYLQGSYKNDTNIRGDSDVDVIVQLNSTFARDVSALPADQVVLQRNEYAIATYNLPELRRDVLQSLRDYYGAACVQEGDRSIKLRASPGRLAVDVIPSMLLKKYQYFYSDQCQQYVEGVKIFSREQNREIVNFPKKHYSNGVAKQSASRTNGCYKSAVRMFKNARTYLTGHHALGDGVAPSYFVECLVYNAPDSAFGGSLQDTFVGVLNSFRGAAPDALWCQNEEQKLFGATQEQWNVEDARAFLNSLSNMWSRW